jgi:glycine cleavage system H lipoate-binding protein
VVQYAPISGTIHEINSNLNDQPGLLNKSPEDEGKRQRSLITFLNFKPISPGWLCKIKVSDPDEVRSPLIYLKYPRLTTLFA